LRGSPKSYLFREELTSRSWATLNDFPAIRDGYVKRDIIPDDAPSSARSLADADMAIPKLRNDRIEIDPHGRCGACGAA
jgi:hypothetical protein